MEVRARAATSCIPRGCAGERPRVRGVRDEQLEHLAREGASGYGVLPLGPRVGVFGRGYMYGV